MSEYLGHLIQIVLDRDITFSGPLCHLQILLHLIDQMHIGCVLVTCLKCRSQRFCLRQHHIRIIEEVRDNAEKLLNFYILFHDDFDALLQFRIFCFVLFLFEQFGGLQPKLLKHPLLTHFFFNTSVQI